MDLKMKVEKDFASHEIYSDSDNIIKDISKLLTLGIESDEIIDETGTVVKPASPVIDKCWSVVYPKVDKTLFPNIQDWDALLPDEYKAVTIHQIEKSEGTIILKTRTIPKDIKKTNTTSIGVNADLNVDSIEMYLELYMPQYLTDSEIDDAMLQRTGKVPVVIDPNSVAGQVTANPKLLPKDVVADKVARNYHHLYMRIFDNINEAGDGPAENVYDPSTRDVVEWHSRSSEWCKLSWYQDFEEVFLSELAGKPDQGVTMGTVRLPITKGITSETKIRIWSNINRNRMVLGVMGSPNVDFSDNRYLIGCAYVGQIDSFDFSVNDTAGNFGIFTTSSTDAAMAKTEIRTRTTVPYKNPAGSTRLPFTNIPEIMPYVNAIEFETTAPDIPPIPYDYSKPDGGDVWGDRFLSKGTVRVYFKSGGANGILVNDVYSDLSISNDAIIPAEIIIDKSDRRVVNIKIKMSDIIRKTCGSKADMILSSEKFSFSKDGKPVTTSLEYSFSYYTEYTTLTGGVKKDAFGNSIKYEYPTTYGRNTATGILDFSMYATFTKDYFQKHGLIFAGTEEFTKKELYGKSAYTGEYFADRIKIFHSSEGPRGILSGIITIDPSSINPFDELIVNEGFKKYKDKPEELFVFLPITAPFCPFSNSPNGRHGIGILKDIRYPVPVTDEEIVDFALDELENKYKGMKVVIKDFPLIDESKYGANITWTSSDASAIDVSGKVVEETEKEKVELEPKTKKK